MLNVCGRDLGIEILLRAEVIDRCVISLIESVQTRPTVLDDHNATGSVRLRSFYRIQFAVEPIDPFVSRQVVDTDSSGSCEARLEQRLSAASVHPGSFDL